VRKGMISSVTLMFAILALLIGQPAKADEIAELVREIYDPYHHAGPVGSLETMQKHVISKKLHALFEYYDRRSSPDEVGTLDFDPFISAQDYELKDVEIVSETIDGDEATVEVGFTNFGDRTELTYTLAKEGGAWKIDDIRSMNPDDPWILSKLLKPE